MSIADLVFPKNCLNCGRGRVYVCSNCLKKVRPSKQVCIICGKPSIDGMTHMKCKNKFVLDGAVALWKYEGVVRQALTKLKYGFAYAIAQELAVNAARLLTKEFTALPKESVVVPVPLHTIRKNWRGFNQSEEIGNLIAEQLKLKFMPDLLIRKKSTTPQVVLNEKGRFKNVRAVFELNRIRTLSIPDKRFFIVFDDVWTTGSTLKEVGKVLKESGAINVWGLTIAR